MSAIKKIDIDKIASRSFIKSTLFWVPQFAVAYYQGPEIVFCSFILLSPLLREAWYIHKSCNQQRKFVFYLIYTFFSSMALSLLICSLVAIYTLVRWVLINTQ